MWGCHAAGAWDWGAQERSLERRAADERIGDGERRRVVDALGAHLSAGRLEIDEFEQRTDDALHARTRRDLDPDFPDRVLAAQATGLLPGTAWRPLLPRAACAPGGGAGARSDRAAARQLRRLMRSRSSLLRRRQ